MENKIIYAVGISYNLGEITEREIRKETPKTYTVGDIGSKWRGDLVKKSDMTCYGKKYFLTYQEAVQYKIELFEKKIERNCAEIIKRQTENAKLSAKLAELRGAGNDSRV